MTAFVTQPSFVSFAKPGSIRPRVEVTNLPRVDAREEAWEVVAALLLADAVSDTVFVSR
jgi:hypothetical protein